MWFPIITLITSVAALVLSIVTKNWASFGSNLTIIVLSLDLIGKYQKEN